MEPSLRLNHILLLLMVVNAGVVVVNADKFQVGGGQMWGPNVNYTPWEQEHNNSIHVNDWLVFLYKEGQADVIQVNETGYNKCDSSYPIANYSKGRSFAYQLKEPKRYYFICSLGYCYGGMRISVVAHPLPPPSPPPAVHSPSLAPNLVNGGSFAVLLFSVSLIVVFRMI
ncbi:hypothetical protein LUZ60_004902 [Juncus effusus]|nr:hypothetical protein LUZ60_004902 [Juncus effusus]